MCPILLLFVTLIWLVATYQLQKCKQGRCYETFNDNISCRWIAQLWSGKQTLPPKTTMLADINTRQGRHQKGCIPTCYCFLERVRTHRYPFELYPNMMEDFAAQIGAVPSVFSN